MKSTSASLLFAVTYHFRLGVVLAFSMFLSAPSGLWADDLDDSFTSLKEGRKFLKDYPGTKTRRGLVNDFVGANGETANRPDLQLAISRAIAIRLSEPTDPESFSVGNAPKSIMAREIAWQALEANNTGYLFAGNKDLLDGTRISYPGGLLATDNRLMPKEEPATFAGTPQRQLSYARLYFLQSIKDVLSFVSRDRTGALRATGSAYPTVPYYVTFDDLKSPVLPFNNKAPVLPADPPLNTRWDDPYFGSAVDNNDDREAAQSVAFSYGSAMERFGLAAVAYADQLWRGAFTGPTAGTARPPAEKQQMLDRAATVLRDNIHAQFLASLPVAAQLSDGTTGTGNDFKDSKIDQARVSVTGAQRLRDQILSGEKPTQQALISAWDVASIEQQLQRCKDSFAAVEEKWQGSNTEGHVVFERARSEGAADLNANREITLRQQFETRLLDLTGIDPSSFGGLRTEANRIAYIKAVTDKYDALFADQDLAANVLNDGSDLSIQALKLLQAVKTSEAAYASVEAYEKKMRVEVIRNLAESAQVIVFGEVINVIDAASAQARLTPKPLQLAGTLAGAAGGAITLTGTEVDSAGAAAAAVAAMKPIAAAAQSIVINTINSAALIKNILIDQATARAQAEASHVGAYVARAEFLKLFNESKRLVEDHLFFQNITNTLWYRDAQLVFKLEKAEEEYLDLVQEYRIELFKLAKMIEASWCERFANPVKESNQSTTPLNNRSFDDFTESESIFGTANHVQAKLFYDALKAWDIRLRDPLYRDKYQYSGPSPIYPDASFISGQPISLRRDIFRFNDVRYDQGSNSFVSDSTLTRLSIQRFRAILLDLAGRDPLNQTSLNRLRLDFPITYQQSKLIENLSSAQPLVTRSQPGGVDQYWNHRMKQIGIKIVGKNVFAAGATVPVSMELFGNIDRVGFFLDSAFNNSRTTTSFQTPLYQRDPDKRIVGEPFFGSAIGIQAAIGSTAVPMYTVSGWPLFCDNIVLRIGGQGTLRIENIDDIELYLKMEVGSPPPIPAASW